jgi:hypothetical protein
MCTKYLDYARNCTNSEVPQPERTAILILGQEQLSEGVIHECC